MASGKYRIKKGKNNWSSIYFRFKQGDKFDLELSTGIRIPFSRWSNPKQSILPTKEIDFQNLNRKLRDLNEVCIKDYSTDSLNGIIIDKNWLKKRISQTIGSDKSKKDDADLSFFTNAYADFINKSKTRRSKSGTLLSERTIKHYITTLQKLKDFCEYEGKNFKIRDIDSKFYINFIEYLQNERFLNPNTIGGYIDDIKQFMSYASKKGYDISQDYDKSEFISPTNSTHDTYLNVSEIKQINDAKMSHDYLENARDWLIIGLWTGLRVSDLLSLTRKNIEGKFIQNVNLKTDFPVIIPIHPHVQAILDKRNGDFPRKISDQKFNKFIKKVAQEAGLNEITKGTRLCPIETVIDGVKKTIHRKKLGEYHKYELISSHVCRRSFATNLYGKIDTLTIMKITGHSTEKQFLDYIKITPQQYADKLKRHWAKEYLS